MDLRSTKLTVDGVLPKDSEGMVWVDKWCVLLDGLSVAVRHTGPTFVNHCERVLASETQAEVAAQIDLLLSSNGITQSSDDLSGKLAEFRLLLTSATQAQRIELLPKLQESYNSQQDVIKYWDIKPNRESGIPE